uniref:Uncharacterized protein OJ1540_H01.27 n=1 Tax=Oryza sativa TaxID=4530 RepID=Q8SB16_ORYSA|nr:hypothetical protein [Oryza sativa Japonica Group]
MKTSTEEAGRGEDRATRRGEDEESIGVEALEDEEASASSHPALHPSPAAYAANAAAVRTRMRRKVEASTAGGGINHLWCEHIGKQGRELLLLHDVIRQR